ncbi:hypothetical protein GH733_010812, partial [Mirounga leonina]
MGASLKDEILRMMPAFVAIGEYSGCVGLGVKCSKEVATAIHGAILLAKLSIVPGNKIKSHTVPHKVTSLCGSVLVRLIPASCAQEAPDDGRCGNCYTLARGCTVTLGNFAKATLDAISKTYSCLNPPLPLTSGKRLCSPSFLISDLLTV